MKKLVLYYSYSSNTRKHASDYAKTNKFELVEVKSAQKISKFKAYTSGCFKAMAGLPMPIEPVTVNLSDYGEVDVFAPIWAGCIAPPMIAALKQLPKGTKVSLHLISASGKSNKEKNTSYLTTLGLEVSDYNDERN